MQNDVKDKLVKIIASKPRLLKNINTSLIKIFHFANHLIANDVVPVVRCKDCKSYNGHRYCNYHADSVDDNDFCSYGERKIIISDSAVKQ